MIPQKDTNHHKSGCYPNFPVRKDKIDLERIKPDEDIIEEDVNLKIERMIPSDNSIFTYLNDSGTLKSIDQIQVIFAKMYDGGRLNRNLEADHTAGTCFVTQFPESTSRQVLSVFHVINMKDMNKFDHIILTNFSEVDCSPILAHVIGEFDQEELYKSITTQKDKENYFIQELEKLKLDTPRDVADLIFHCKLNFHCFFTAKFIFTGNSLFFHCFFHWKK